MIGVSTWLRRPVKRELFAPSGLAPAQCEQRPADPEFFPFPDSLFSYAGPVFTRLGHALLILALVAALGGHWAVLQTVAWTNMLATQLRTGSLEDAVTKTFDGNHPCGLCKEISAGKKAERRTEFPEFTKKLECISDRLVFVFSPPAIFYLVPEPKASVRLFSLQPPVPPPRRLTA